MTNTMSMQPPKQCRQFFVYICIFALFSIFLLNAIWGTWCSKVGVGHSRFAMSNNFVSHQLNLISCFRLVLSFILNLLPKKVSAKLLVFFFTISHHWLFQKTKLAS